MKDLFLQFREDIKTAVGIAFATVGTGLGLILDVIPQDIGKASTVVGMALSSVLIYTHWRRGRIDYKKAELEIEIMQRKECERREKERRRSMLDLYASARAGGPASAGPFARKSDESPDST